MTSYPTPEFRRTALAPGLLAAIALIAGAALLGTDGFIWIQFATSILALIVSVYGWQSGGWWWVIPLAVIAIAWNPIVPFNFAGPVWQAAQFVAAGVFIAAGVRIRIRVGQERGRR